ncbi:hypothetical protein D3C87_1183490 [compost metagenome]
MGVVAYRKRGVIAFFVSANLPPVPQSNLFGWIAGPRCFSSTGARSESRRRASGAVDRDGSSGCVLFRKIIARNG